MSSLGNQILAKGRQEGRQEKIFETHKKALQAGVPIEFIVQITGLPIKEILEIQK